MSKLFRKLMLKNDGLTLIELIVVVAILAILAFTITPRVLDSLDNSKLNGARSVANELHSAMERYFANQGVSGAETYPMTTVDDWDELRLELGNTLALTNSADNVFAADPTYEPNTLGAEGAVETLGTRADWYCVEFTGRDRVPTTFTITPKGVYENVTGCPVDADDEPS